MSKLTAPLHSFIASGRLGKALSFRRSGSLTIAEKQPHFPDQKTPAQLNQRLMYQQCTDLWNLLSTAEKKEWDSLARPKHMPPYAMFMSYCLKPNPGVYLPLAGGTMSGDIAMAGAQTVDGIDISAHAADLQAHTKNPLDPLRTGEYISTLQARGEGVADMTWNLLYAVPWFAPRTLTVDRIACVIHTAAAGALRLGIYQNGTNLTPGALLLDAGTIDTGSTGIKAIIINQQLTKGLYWLAAVTNAGPTVRVHVIASPQPFGLTSSANFAYAYDTFRVAFTYAALPNPFPAGGTFLSIAGILIPLRILSLD